MQRPGIILVHGYTGSPDDLSPLSRTLVRQYGQETVRSVCLPHHRGIRAPRFDADLFEQAIVDALIHYHREKRRIILIGHSTGGNLALNALRRANITPALLILASVPYRVTGCDLNRWEIHRANQSPIKLIDVARMVSYINHVGGIKASESCPLMVLNGGADDLVHPSQGQLWQDNLSGRPVQDLVIPLAGHDLFTGLHRHTVIDYICRGVDDLLMSMPSEHATDARRLEALEGDDLSVFMGTDPRRRSHLVRSPSARRALDRCIEYKSDTNIAPLQLNIEVTSRCNLRCGHCARSVHPRPARDISPETFSYLLDLLPNAYRVAMVGLGEPTLHPCIAELVSQAVNRGHRVSLVTNAMTLDVDLTRRLLSAGLSAITFSLDSVDDDLVAKVRPGSELKCILENIRRFVSRAEGKISMAVFSAVSTRTIEHLPALARVVAGLGVDAWMLSDLNFSWNKVHSLERNWSSTKQNALKRALRIAFGKGLPVISVRALEEMGLSRRFREFLLTSSAGFVQRSKTHRWCLSPWQTV